MKRQIVFLPEVSRDFARAFNYYESLSPSHGGTGFKTAFRTALEEVERGLITHTRHFQFYHRVFIGKYPYSLYYRLAEEKAVIVGVLYARFTPGTNRTNVADESRRKITLKLR